MSRLLRFEQIIRLSHAGPRINLQRVEIAFTNRVVGKQVGLARSPKSNNPLAFLCFTRVHRRATADVDEAGLFDIQGVRRTIDELATRHVDPLAADQFEQRCFRQLSFWFLVFHRASGDDTVF